MAEPTGEISQVPTAGNDPFLRLHKMSTTAGVGTQDYVAINVVSVFAMILGIASALALLSGILLVIPAVGIVCAIVALVQISRSNGTQTGRGLAWGGMVLALIFAGLVGGREVRDAAADRADQRVIANLISQIDADVRAENWSQLYARFDDHFTERVRPDVFAERWKTLQKSPYFGKIKSVSWNEKAVFFTDPNSQERIGQSLAVFTTDSQTSPEQRQEIGFRKVNNETWMIEDLPSIFPAEQPQQRAPRGAPAPR